MTDNCTVDELKNCKKNLSELQDKLERLKATVGHGGIEDPRYRFMMENSRDVLWTISMDGRWRFVSENVEKIIGIPARDIINKTIWDFVAPEYHEQVREKLKKRMAGIDVPPYEVEIVAGKGIHMPFELVTSTIKDENGNLIGIQGISRDITERKAAERELKTAYHEMERRVKERTSELDKARSTLQTILDTAPIGIIVADAASGRLSYSSKGVIPIFGTMVKGIAGAPEAGSYELLLPDGSPYPPELLPIPRSLYHGETLYNVELLVRRNDGSEVPVLVNSAPIKGQDGRIVSAVATVMDITHRKSIEEDLEDARSQAELYLDLMGHDINNYNQIAIGYLELVKNTLPADDERVQYLDKSIEMLGSSSQLIDNVMKIQRAREGAASPGSVDMLSFLYGVRDVYAKPSRININIILEVPNERGIYVKANKLLKDVFSNIVGNAVKHSADHKQVNIDIIVKRSTGGYYRIEFADDGPGIPDNVKAVLFERFRRGKTRAAGKGLGLYIVKTLVQDFKGKVWVEDRVPGDYNKGTRFIVLLQAA